MKTTLSIISIFALFSIGSCQKKAQEPIITPIGHLPKILKEISGLAYNNDLIYAISDQGNPNKVVVIL